MLFMASSSGADNDADKVDFKKNNILGDVNGDRTSLYKKGVNLEAIYKLDVMANTSGGIKSGAAVLDNLDLKLTLDGSKLYSVIGSKVFVYVLSNRGTKPNGKYVGSIQGVDNIEVIQPATRLYEAWISQDIMDGKVSLLVGLHDLNSEFYVTNSSLLFLGPNYGTGGEFSVTGKNGPSIFPTTSLAFRVKLQPNPNFYFQAAIWDAVPGDPNKQGTHITLQKNDGALLVAESGWQLNNDKYALGVWCYTPKFNDFLHEDRKHNAGAYISLEKQLYKKNDTTNIISFVRAGLANQAVTPVHYAWSAGILYNGVVTGRDSSQLGLGISQIINSNKLRQSIANSGGSLKANETSFELTYSDSIRPGIAIQPDVQYIIYPGSTPKAKNAFVLGGRLTLTF